MNGNTQQDSKPVRLVFELARVDNPRLYDELVRFAKGAKRVNRLRVLAYDGLLAQYGVIVSPGSERPTASLDLAQAVPRSAAITNEVFGPAVGE